MIVTRGLTKRYGHLLVVDQVDLDVREGDRYGFLGPNGSGKTTVVRMLLGLVYATSGEITVLGQPVPKRAAEVLPSIGALVEGPSAYGHLSGRANLALIDAAGKSGSRRTRGSRSPGSRSFPVPAGCCHTVLAHMFSSFSSPSLFLLTQGLEFYYFLLLHADVIDAENQVILHTSPSFRRWGC